MIQSHIMEGLSSPWRMEDFPVFELQKQAGNGDSCSLKGSSVSVPSCILDDATLENTAIRSMVLAGEVPTVESIFR
jgi:hypothetical protein